MEVLSINTYGYLHCLYHYNYFHYLIICYTVIFKLVSRNAGVYRTLQMHVNTEDHITLFLRIPCFCSLLVVCLQKLHIPQEMEPCQARELS